MVRHRSDYLKNNPVRSQKAEIRKIDKRISRLLNSIADGINPALVSDKVEALEKQKAALQAEVRHYDAVKSSTNEKSEYAKILTDFLSRESDNTSYRKALVSSFVHRIEISPESITVIFNFKSPANTLEKTIIKADDFAQPKCKGSPVHSAWWTWQQYRRTLYLQYGYLCLELRRA